jgi:CubicO group peptidase (beta-lactamase class C family)
VEARVHVEGDAQGPGRRVSRGGTFLSGFAAPGFEDVRQAFGANFARRRELGAACAVYHRGKKVVDLWGGWRDARRSKPWREDTLVLVYSTSKGLAAIAVAVAHSRGLIDLDATVASYWPEFAANGKEAVTVRQLLSHQAGLCAVDERLDAQTLGDLDAVAAAVARQAPAWEPGTRHGYHPFSIGWYESELIRRADPQGRSLGRFFAEEVARPLGLEFYFGLPEDVGADRIASIKGFSRASALVHLRAMPPRMVAGFARRGSLTYRAFANPKLRGPADLDAPEYRAVELTAAAGMGEVRSIAKAYGELATGGSRLGIEPATLDELTGPPRPPSGGVEDLVLRVPTAYAAGFMKPSDVWPFAPSPRAFGHPGAGGSFAFADPDAELGFAYAPNRLGHHLRDDPREKALRDAVYRSLS